MRDRPDRQRRLASRRRLRDRACRRLPRGGHSDRGGRFFGLGLGLGLGLGAGRGRTASVVDGVRRRRARDGGAGDARTSSPCPAAQPAHGQRRRHVPPPIQRSVSVIRFRHVTGHLPSTTRTPVPFPKTTIVEICPCRLRLGLVELGSGPTPVSRLGLEFRAVVWT